MNCVEQATNNHVWKGLDNLTDGTMVDEVAAYVQQGGHFDVLTPLSLRIFCLETEKNAHDCITTSHAPSYELTKPKRARKLGLAVQFSFWQFAYQ